MQALDGTRRAWRCVGERGVLMNVQPHIHAPDHSGQRQLDVHVVAAVYVRDVKDQHQHPVEFPTCSSNVYVETCCECRGCHCGYIMLQVGKS